MRNMGTPLCFLVCLLYLISVLGCGSTTVPDLGGLSYFDAEQALAGRLISVGSLEVAFSDELAAGLVMAQNPVAGTEVVQGAAVDLTVSQGREPGTGASAPTMRSVPRGTFAMGDEDGDEDELPVHTVLLSAYEIAATEVTNARFAAVLNWALQQGYIDGGDGDVIFNGKTLLAASAAACQIDFVSGTYQPVSRDGQTMANHPVVMVSWYGAVAYCNWLSEAAGLPICYNLSKWRLADPHAGGYRLPTEAEWERAAAWDSDLQQHWRYGFASEEIDRADANYDGENVVRLVLDPLTTPVAFYAGRVSPVGAYDMSGNVIEWCQDWEDVNPYPVGPVENPSGPDNGVRRICRGGGWFDQPYRCRTAYRSAEKPDQARDYLGFRLAR